MAHGTPDWWGVEPTNTVYQMQDAGELAARLGSPDTYDRRGNVLLMDSFEDGIGGWVSNKSGAGASVALSAERALYGAYSVKLVGGSDALRDAVIGRYVGYPIYSRHGVEVAVAWGDDVDYIEIQLNFRDGTTAYLSSIRYDPVADVFEYMDSAADWQEIDGAKALYDVDYVFHRFKFVTDLDLLQYSRALLDDEEYSLRGQAIFSLPSAADPMMGVNIYCFSTAGHNATAYVDGVIITQNEP